MSPSLRTMGFFMSDINFCNTKEQLNHLGEVVTGKVDGSPSGADIDTSTLYYTGQVRKTLPALEGEYEQSITDKESEADAAIDSYRLLNKGDYAAGIILSNKFEFIEYNGEAYFANNPPYTTTATTPDSDSNLFIGGYITETQANIQAIARGLNVKTENVIYSNNTTDLLDSVTHIYDVVTENIVVKPTSIPSGERIISLSGALLETTNGEYTLVDSPEPESYTLIRKDVSMIPTEISKITQGLTTVITGDSLSFNGFGYPASWGVVGTQYATNNPFGMSSWAHMFRDMWLTSGQYQPINKSRFYGSCSNLLVGDLIPEKIGVNQRALLFQFSSGDELTIVNEYSGSSALVISTVPSGDECTFKVNGVSHTNESDTGDYEGYEYKLIPFTGNTVTISEVVDVGSSTANLIVYGIANSTKVIPKLTGKGGYTSTQILAEYNDLVGQYSPDIIFYIIGANDLDINESPVDSGYSASVRQFIDTARTAKPSCVIVLISLPKSSSFTKEASYNYVREGYSIALEKGCSHIDLYAETENINPDYWRFDNIHCKTLGDTLWFNILKNYLAPTTPIDNSVFTPVREAVLGVNNKDMARNSESFRFTIQTALGSPVISDLPSDIAGSVNASYGSFSGELVVTITVPEGFEIASLDPFVTTPSQINTIRLQSGGSPNSNTFRVTGMFDNTTVDPNGTNVYALVTVVKDTSSI